MQQQPFLLTITYARGLKYWAERLNPPESPDFCPLVGSVIELREMVREHIMFTNWDLLQGLGRVNPGVTSQWPHPRSSSRVVPPLGNEPSEPDTGLTEATTQTASLAMSCIEPLRCITPLDGMEEENWYLLVITTSIRQPTHGLLAIILESHQLPHLEGILSRPHVWHLFSLGQQGQSVIKVPPGRSWRSDVENGTSEQTDDHLWVEE